jgi:glucose/mannose-6-phosphate isomerase
MNLDDLELFARLDSQAMGEAIDGLPDQLAAAWGLGQEFDLPAIDDIERVVIAGLGGSAIGADLLRAYAVNQAEVPIEVWRDYDLPAYAAGPATLVIASSHSGNTEETLSGFERGLAQGASLLAVTTGGELAERAEAEGVPVWRFEHDGQPRAAVGYSFGLLLAALCRLGLLPDAAADVVDAVEEMKRQQKQLTAEVTVTSNPAKRMAGQLIDRWPTIIGAEFLGPVARRWRTQIAELAKAVAQFEILPEADHNMVAGVEAPEGLFGATMVVFLEAAALHLRNRVRTRLTREILMVEGFNTDAIRAVGQSKLAQQWTPLHFGDYVSYYLAMAYETDPSPVRAIASLKERLEEV